MKDLNKKLRRDIDKEWIRKKMQEKNKTLSIRRKRQEKIRSKET